MIQTKIQWFTVGAGSGSSTITVSTEPVGLL